MLDFQQYFSLPIIVSDICDLNLVDSAARLSSTTSASERADGERQVRGLEKDRLGSYVGVGREGQRAGGTQR